jgi:spermidine synthase
MKLTMANKLARSSVAIIAAAALLWLSNASADSVIHEERSLYSAIIVKKIGATLCLQFTVREDQRNQSCINVRNRRDMLFTYTRMSMAGLLFVDDPKNILVIGLGGGTLPMAFHDLFPEANIQSVEIDAAVVKVAREYFGFKEGPRMHVDVQDARVWTKRAMRKETRYDLIVLDAFNGDYIPEHLMTKEYLEESKAILTPNGTLMANTFTISDLYNHESNTYLAVFDEVLSFQTMQSANRVIIAPGLQLTDDELKARAKKIRPLFKPYSVPIRRYARDLIRIRKKGPNWDTTARILTDQYSPANLLGTQ